jgi:hypothetical protein
MKRFLIFALLGPPLGFVAGFWVLLQFLNLTVGAPSTIDYHQLVLLPVSYMMGIVPALIVVTFDHLMRNSRYRILWTTLFAYAAGFLPILGALAMGFIQSFWILPFGLIGAIPGAICSWLAGRGEKATET